MDIKNLYFQDLRFQMSHFSRFLTRLIYYSSYSILAVAGVTFLFSDIKQLFWTGVFIAIFLGDKIIHLGQAQKSFVGLTRRFPRLSRRKDHEVILPENINAAHYFSSASFRILESAYDKTSAVGENFYLRALKFLVQLPEIKNGLARMDIDVEKMEKQVEAIINGNERKNKIDKKELFFQAEATAKAAFIVAIANNNRFIEPVDLFSALGEIDDSQVNKIFTFFEINSLDLGKVMIFSRFKKGFWSGLPKNLGGFAARPKKVRHRVMNRAWTSKPTPTLDSFSIDFTDLAAAGEAGFLIGHKQEYERLVDILSRPIKPNALLIGEPGSGKETVISALAHHIIKDEVPEALFDKRLVSLQLGNLISGASAPEISSRLNKVVEEIISSGNIILYIPDIHNLVKTSGDAINAADILMPVINNDAFPIIGATYPKEFKQFIEPLSDFVNAFENIRIEEISEDDAIKILTYDGLILEKQHKTTISFGAIKTAVELSHKYFRQKLLPSSAQDLLRESLSAAVSRKDKLLQADDVIDVVERKINIPVRRAGKEEAGKLLNLENIIHESLIDQEVAVSSVSRALREYRSGLSRKGGPIAAFLFVGPTGVGKTELSKILAKIQFGSENLMVRFDMSEYQTKESIMRFIGTPDGKISGNLTDAIMQKPFSLVLLDEFEKAHPDILNLFLQVFDDGRLTDSLSRTVDFSDTIIIATSNAHSNFIKERIEAGDKIEKISDELKKKLTEYFKPELLNRFSQIVVFKNLSREDIAAIAKLQLKSLAKNLEEQGIGFSCDEEAVLKIAELGYDPVFGARPLRGVISEKLRGVLAEKILRGEIAKGDSIKAIIGANSEFEFVKL